MRERSVRSSEPFNARREGRELDRSDRDGRVVARMKMREGLLFQALGTTYTRVLGLEGPRRDRQLIDCAIVLLCFSAQQDACATQLSLARPLFSQHFFVFYFSGLLCGGIVACCGLSGCQVPTGDAAGRFCRKGGHPGGQERPGARLLQRAQNATVRCRRCRCRCRCG